MTEATSDGTPDGSPDGSPTRAQASPEFVAWARHHEEEHRAYRPELAEVSEHQHPEGTANAAHQEQVWAARRDHEQRLHDSAIEQIRHHDS
ncbi:hypothetical protein [Cyanobium sp. NIES-981]|uniref:hypothetical protein n=1 Tax=Cyanobium sp. NIES-981 TaxID=1851505 RepID=UPI0012FA9CF8|nr:hypothetical protein [Cyanobium sp. NIES-981]